MSKIVYVTKDGRGVFREGPYTDEEEFEWYSRQTPKAMHHNIQQGGSAGEPTTVDPLPGKVPPPCAPPFDLDMSYAEWVSRYGTTRNPKKPEDWPPPKPKKPVAVQVRYDVLSKAFGYDDDEENDDG